MDRKLWGYWDCNFCGTKKIRASYKTCQYCGHPCDHNSRFYMDKDNIEYLTEEESELYGKGADWVCAYCDSLNSIVDNNCKYCGASHNDSVKNYFDLKNERMKDEKLGNIYETPTTSTYYDPYNTYETYEKKYSIDDFTEAQSYDPIRPKSNKFSNVFNVFRNNLQYILIALISIFAISGLIYLLIPKAKEITVTQTS